MNIDFDKLNGFIPDRICAQLPDLCAQFDIDGPLRLAHLVGQTREETGNYSIMSENLNYSGTALWSMFHKHFASEDEANAFARQPEKIANRIYANRMGNGDEESGDGWLYRGRGGLQTTGKENYKLLGDFLGIDLVSNPDLVATDYAMASAAFFFKKNNLWVICDRGVDTDTITALTIKVNGGTINLATRIDFTTKAYNFLTGDN